MKPLLAMLLLALAVRGTAQDLPTPIEELKEGVYCRTPTAPTGVIIVFELKAGQFRYWATRSNQVDGLKTDFRTGTYATAGGTVKFAVKSPLSPLQNFEFSSIEYKGRTLLWSASSRKNWEKTLQTRSKNMPDPLGAFYLTNKPPEEWIEEQLALAARRISQMPRSTEAAEPLGHVPNGTFYNDFISEDRQKTRRVIYANVLELKDGEFKLWLSRGSNKTQQAWSMLESGKYKTNGSTVTFVAVRNPKNAPMTNEWTFMNFRGQTSVWMKGIWEDWKRGSSLNTAGILFRTDRKPQDILDGK